MTSKKQNYLQQFELKYGCNPHQKPAAIHSLEGRKLPFSVLNGQTGLHQFAGRTQRMAVGTGT